MKNLIHFILAASAFLSFSCKSKNQKLDNITAFTKVYGYVKYFHPSDEAAGIYWDKFAIYGASQIEKCQSREELLATLNQLFKPIAPSIQFASNPSQFDTTLKRIIPDSLNKYGLTYWQHFGLGTGMRENNNAYKSLRVNRDVLEGIRLFNYEVKPSESIIEKIGDDLYCQVPIALYCNEEATFPKANADKLAKLEKELLNTYEFQATDLSFRLGNVINTFNVFQHFYPYFEEVDIDWENAFKTAIEQCYTDATKEDHLITLQKLTAHLADGHITISNKYIKNHYMPAITWEWIEGQLVITYVDSSVPKLHVGDIVTHINKQKANLYFDHIKEKISAGTTGWLNARANILSLTGKKNSSISIETNNKSYSLKRTDYYWKFLKKINQKPSYQALDNGIWYLNLDKVEMDTIRYLLPQLSESSAIICDLRGYPNDNHEFIQYLMAIDDTTSSWMQVPKIVYADHEKVVGYSHFNWIKMMKAKKPHLGNKKIIFIIDGRAISYAESYMAFIEGYRLATIIGQPTAGTNGNVNEFKLPGGYKIRWTGMKVLKHDGSQLHGVGIIPDILLEKSILGVINGQDEFLNKALELAKTP